MKEILKRHEVPVESTWDLKDLYPSNQAFLEGITAVQGQTEIIKGFKGQLLKDPTILFQSIEGVSACRLYLINTILSQTPPGPVGKRH